MSNFIVTAIHHGGSFTTNPPKYNTVREFEIFHIDKDHFSLVELCNYTKEMGYDVVKNFYYFDPIVKDFFLITSDFQMLNLVKDLKHGDKFEVYVMHVVCEPQLIDNSPIGLIDSQRADTDSEIESSASELDDIPEEDDSDVDEELKTFRAERRAKKATKEAAKAAEKKKADARAKEISLGEAGIDRGFEDIGKDRASKYVGKLGGDEEYIGSSDLGSEDSHDEVEGDEGVDLPRRRKSIKVRYDPACEIAIFELGMVFDNAIAFRKAVANYAIENKVQLKLRPNDKGRVRVKCKNSNCSWLLFASLDNDSGDFIVKNYYPVHQCTTTNKNKLLTSSFIASKFKDRITSQPSITILEIQGLVRERFGLYVGRTVAYRAKMKVIREFMGDWKMEFSRLCDYADMIKSTNPGSSCWVKTDTVSELGKNLFVYFYVCFDALKKGWLGGCRKIIGFDGCFLKGACQGELLVAIGKNGNQQMYPIAWAVVGTETTHSWTWFIQHLISDLELGSGEGLTVMSDMQKGIIPTIRQLLPEAEHRFCARHIWANWSKTWKGEERRRQFWRCAKSSFEVKFKDEMDNLARLGEREMCDDLLEYNCKSWCRAYFSEYAKCDVVENNMCETFNSWILAARHKSIISMLEEIRHKIMRRHVDMRRFSDTWISDITPLARLSLEESKDLSKNCEILWNGEFGFEIEEGEFVHTIDLGKRTCTCRSWQLRGIPCAHVVTAYYHLNQEPEDQVEKWYRRKTFLKAYKHVIQPIPNMKMWPPTNNMSIEPPAPRTMPGRPKRCRRKSKDEPRKKHGKLSKKGVKMTCSNCKQQGHNKKMCPNLERSSREQSNGIPTQSRQHTSNSSFVRTAASAGRGMGRGRGNSKGREHFIPPGRGASTATAVNRGMGSSSQDGDASTAVRCGQKRPRQIGFGLFIDPNTSKTVLNPGTTSERVVMRGNHLKNAAETNVDLGFYPKGLKWRGKKAISTAQLQQIRASRMTQETTALTSTSTSRISTEGTSNN